MAVDVRRKVPSVDALLRSDPARRAASTLGRPLLKRMLEDVLAEVRSAAAEGEDPPPDEVLLARALGRASRAAQGMVPVINATGVILHTNLGRAPLPERAARAAARAARSYTDIEVDRQTGRRGRRGGHAETLLTALTGAEGAMVVNNCAAALLLAMAALAKGKPVLVSRGELIEIGGEFRIPDILAASGARLAEVGTTNRTRIGDYRAAVTDKTGMILKVHPSNYRMIGFTAAPAAVRPVGARPQARHPVPLRHRLGAAPSRPWTSGGRALRLRRPGAGSGPRHVLRGQAARRTPGGHHRGTGGDCWSGSRRHPIARAVRIGRMQMAALEQVLAIIATGREVELPVFRMLRESPEIVREPGPAPVRDDRRRARGRARGALRVGRRRGLDAGHEPPVVGGSDPGAGCARVRGPPPDGHTRRVLTDGGSVRPPRLPDGDGRADPPPRSGGALRARGRRGARSRRPRRRRSATTPSRRRLDE